MGMVHRFVFMFLLAPLLASAQSLVDQATVLRSMEQSHGGNEALRCEVTPIKPTLNFGLRLQTGYAFRVPLSQFSGPDHRLTVLIRITMESAPAPVFLMDTVTLPPVPPTDLEAEMGGGFFVGEGHYYVNWLLVDERGRTCRKDWELNAELSHGDRSVKLVMPPNQVAELSLRASTAADRHPDPVAPMRLTVLLDAAPVSAGGAVRSSLGPGDQVFLLGALSALLERIPATSVRLVAFNLAQQKELYRRDGFTLDSMDQLAAVLNRLQLAKVDYQAVQSPTGHLNLLANLINQELRRQAPSDTGGHPGTARAVPRQGAIGRTLSPPGYRATILLSALPGAPRSGRADTSEQSHQSPRRQGRRGRWIASPGLGCRFHFCWAGSRFDRCACAGDSPRQPHFR